MRLRDLRRGLAVPVMLLFFLFLMVFISSADYYYFDEKESGWNTGFRQSTNLTMDISGFSMGDGSHSRYGEIGLADVRVKDRTSSANGTLVYREGMHITSEILDDVFFDAAKPAGSQNWYVVVNESWPVSINSYRTLDFSGRRIDDLEYFGNNFEYAGSSVLYATELRKDTSADLVLRDAHFNAIIDDESNKILQDEFKPNLTLNVDQRSSFNGLATTRFRHSVNRRPASEGEERYWGDFTIMRSVGSSINNSTYLYEPAMECCMSSCDYGGCSILTSEGLAAITRRAASRR